MKLFMLLLGCTPKGRNTEQHDIFFGIAETLKDLVPAIIEAWPEAKGKIHIDAWRQVNYVDQHTVDVFDKQQLPPDAAEKKNKLFFSGTLAARKRKNWKSIIKKWWPPEKNHLQ